MDVDSSVEEISEPPPSKPVKCTDAKIFVIVGASGYLAKKTVYPALWDLFQQHRLPDHVLMIGYARSKLSVRDIKNRCRDFCTGIGTERGRNRYENFWRLHKYVAGGYNSDRDNGTALARAFEDFEANYKKCDRIFYLAVPSLTYVSLAEMISRHWKAPKGCTKVALEKPFGMNKQSMKDLEDLLDRYFQEPEICRIDHNLTLDLVDSIMSLRFANRFYKAVWNKENIAAVLITFKEDLGTKGRGNIFDKTGIIRDIMHNHMLQILSFVGMIFGKVNRWELLIHSVFIFQLWKSQNFLLTRPFKLKKPKSCVL